MKKRILAAALCLTLLSGCGARPPLDLPDAESDRAVIAYVPLDDGLTTWAGGISGGKSGLCPEYAEEWMFKTLLDGRWRTITPKTVWKHNPGPGKAAIPASCTIGCWNRRHQAVTATFFPWTRCSMVDWWPPVWRKPPQSVTASLASDRFAGKPAVRFGGGPNNEVWLLDSVMRLAPPWATPAARWNTTTPCGPSARHPENLTGDELTLENIRATYDTDADGHDLLRFEDSVMHDAALRYTEHRINKLTLSGELLETVSRIGGDRFHVLIGIDDSSSEDCIQKMRSPICRLVCGRRCYPFRCR